MARGKEVTRHVILNEHGIILGQASSLPDSLFLSAECAARTMAADQAMRPLNMARALERRLRFVKSRKQK
jgi:hypothetical protein